MKSSLIVPALIGAWALMTVALGLASAAKVKRAPNRVSLPPAAVAPPVVVRADSAVRKAPQPGPVARNPGPVLPPASPIADRTTIVPFPIPGDTSPGASERAKLLNVPREGVTTLAPVPRGYYVLRDARTGMVFRRADGTFDSTRETPPEFSPPEQTGEMAPVYPKAARDAGVQGTVWVMAHFLVDGTIREAHVSRSIPGLDSAAVVTVRRMKFRPALINGKPADVWVELPVKFTLH